MSAMTKRKEVGNEKITEPMPENDRVFKGSSLEVVQGWFGPYCTGNTIEFEVVVRGSRVVSINGTLPYCVTNKSWGEHWDWGQFTELYAAARNRPYVDPIDVTGLTACGLDNGSQVGVLQVSQVISDADIQGHARVLVQLQPVKTTDAYQVAKSLEDLLDDPSVGFSTNAVARWVDRGRVLSLRAPAYLTCPARNVEFLCTSKAVFVRRVPVHEYGTVYEKRWFTDGAVALLCWQLICLLLQVHSPHKPTVINYCVSLGVSTLMASRGGCAWSVHFTCLWGIGVVLYVLIVCLPQFSAEH
eukprot:NODE_2500_length_1050_cov_74.655471_g2482_i0.p1 GENE.NODE_2500_length_1050_cov_74.655471_g2482_i0~~NODE_2500_length_1050_cov_74.655471_g2482_i0.p1  ORF type:complete len:300 (+),score=15.79 NODE_2500_length_1050_cov_74.655471_g2482_i0:83-982(+)